MIAHGLDHSTRQHLGDTMLQLLPSRRLRLIAAHVDNSAASGRGSATAAVVDNYANTWSLRSGKLFVTTPGNTHPTPVSTPLDGDAVAGVAADDNGYLWITDGARGLFRLNPRGDGYGPPGPGGGVEYTASHPDAGNHALWRTFDPGVLPAGSIASLRGSSTRDRAVVTMRSGEAVQVALGGLGGLDGGPPRSLAEALPPPDTSSPRWEAAGGRLPCGNHDIYAAECNGKIYVSGGAIWYRGYPARSAEFDELWVLECPGSADDPGAWAVVGERTAGVGRISWALIPSLMT
jgi:hypothetical protein